MKPCCHRVLWKRECIQGDKLVYLEELHGDVEVDGHLVGIQVLEQRQEDRIPHVRHHHLRTHTSKRGTMRIPNKKMKVGASTGSTEIGYGRLWHGAYLLLSALPHVASQQCAKEGTAHAEDLVREDLLPLHHEGDVGERLAVDEALEVGQ